MELESVRALKAEIAERVVRPAVVETRMTRPYAVSARPLRRTTRVEAGISLGIGGAGPRKYRLAVRVQHRDLDTTSGLRARILDICRGEADIRYIGRVSKRTAASAAAAPWHQQRQRPLLIGCSAAHFAVTAGTLGAFVRQRKTLTTAILSNNHVLANENRARVGDAIIQPGPYDGGRRRADRIGALLDFAPLKPGAENLVDVAIAGLDAGIDFDAATLVGLGTLGGRRAGTLEPGDVVAKVGRTTGVTRGVVSAIEVDDLVIGYDAGNLSFNRQIEIESTNGGPFSDGGDSGSVIVDAAGMACALLFAGSDQGGSNGLGLTYANDLDLALQQVDAELVVRSGTP